MPARDGGPVNLNASGLVGLLICGAGEPPHATRRKCHRTRMALAGSTGTDSARGLRRREVDTTGY